MLIAQITDLHIGFDPGNPDENNMVRLRAVIERLVSGPNLPDLLLLSGDLTEFGDAADYARLSAAVAPCPFPVLPMAGNHDLREPLLAAFPQTPVQDGFVQYTLALPGLRLIVLDTLEPGRHGGAFCEARASWLSAQLAADRETPTLIAMHHPPLETGLDWLDGSEREPWMVRFCQTIAGHAQVKGIVCGHLHRPIQTVLDGVPVSVCPSTAPAVGLDLTPLDPERPDGRALITDELPAYALHLWNGRRLVTHVEYVAPAPVLARFDGSMLGIVRLIDAERAPNGD